MPTGCDPGAPASVCTNTSNASGGSAVSGVWKDAHRVEIKKRWSYDSKKYAFLQILTKTQILFAKSII